MLAYAAQTRLPVVRTLADLNKTSVAEPGLLFASEGADFLEGNLDGLSGASQRGLRQLQLVHYIRNAVGDFQTESPDLGGWFVGFWPEPGRRALGAPRKTTLPGTPAR